MLYEFVFCFLSARSTAFESPPSSSSIYGSGYKRISADTACLRLRIRLLDCSPSTSTSTVRDYVHVYPRVHHAAETPSHLIYLFVKDRRGPDTACDVMLLFANICWFVDNNERWTEERKVRYIITDDTIDTFVSAVSAVSVPPPRRLVQSSPSIYTPLCCRYVIRVQQRNGTWSKTNKQTNFVYHSSSPFQTLFLHILRIISNLFCLFTPFFLPSSRRNATTSPASPPKRLLIAPPVVWRAATCTLMGVAYHMYLLYHISYRYVIVYLTVEIHPYQLAPLPPTPKNKNSSVSYTRLTYHM